MRAALVLLAIVLGLTDGCPMPDRERAKHLPQLVQEVLVPVRALRVAAMSMVAPLRRELHLTQRWSLFGSAGRRLHRMVIEAREAGRPTWEPVFRAPSEGDVELARRLGYRRMRGSWDPRASGPRGAYPAFVIWVGNFVLARQPRFDAVRVKMEELAVGDDGGVTSTGKTQHSAVHRRPPAEAPKAVRPVRRSGPDQPPPRDP